MLEALANALGAATLAVALGVIANKLEIGRRFLPIDLGCIAAIVASCVLGTQLGMLNNNPSVGSLVGALIGTVAATLLRRLVA